MQLIYSQTHEEREKQKYSSQYVDTLGIIKRSYLKVFPPVIKLFGRGPFIAIILLFIQQAQEISILVENHHQLANSRGNYSTVFFEYINFSTFVNIFYKFFDIQTSVYAVFFITFLINISLITLLFILFVLFYTKEFSIKQAKKLSLFTSFMISTYQFIIFLPSIHTSAILIFATYSSSYILVGLVNFILTWLIGNYKFNHNSKREERGG